VEPADFFEFDDAAFVTMMHWSSIRRIFAQR